MGGKKTDGVNTELEGNKGVYAPPAPQTHTRSLTSAPRAALSAASSAALPSWLHSLHKRKWGKLKL